MDMCLDVELHYAQLHFPLLSAKEDDPVKAIAAIEANHLLVEGSTLLEALREDVRLDSPDRHAISLPGRRRSRYAWAKAVGAGLPLPDVTDQRPGGTVRWRTGRVVAGCAGRPFGFEWLSEMTRTTFHRDRRNRHHRGC